LWGIIEERVQTTARSTTGRLNAQYVWSPVSVDALIERDRDSNSDAILDERVYALQDANWVSAHHRHPLLAVAGLA
jgi:hypothetical protein